MQACASISSPESPSRVLESAVVVPAPIDAQLESRRDFHASVRSLQPHSSLEMLNFPLDSNGVVVVVVVVAANYRR